jgi:hypothetical protein
MSINVLLDTFKGTIDMAIQEFAKVAGAKVCELIDEKKDELWETGMKVALSKFEEDPEYTKGLLQKITDAVEKNITELKPVAETAETPEVTGGSLSKRKSKRRQPKKRVRGKSRKQYI